MIRPFWPIAGFCGALLAVSSAAADVQVQFTEGAPKDRFTISNTGACALGPVDVTIDLSGSNAGLVFDVTGRGAGVEVFQPFELTSGSALLSSYSEVLDGDNSITLSLIDLPADQSLVFTIDVDDTLGAVQTTVSRSEISGAGIRVKSQMAEVTGTFDASSVATAPYQACIS